MSIATNSPVHELRSQTYNCEHDPCQGVRTAQGSVQGSYCSHECYLRAQGQALLNVIKHDHRYCYTCFRRLKDVHRPSEEWQDRKTQPVEIALDQGAEFTSGPDGILELDASECVYRKAIDPESVIGFQHWGEHATHGEVRIERPDGVPDDTRIGLVCTCGQTNHADRDDIIQGADIKAVVEHLHATLEALGEEGQHSTHVDLDTLVDVLYAQYQHDPGYDFPLAVGIAAEADGDRDA